MLTSTEFLVLDAITLVLVLAWYLWSRVDARNRWPTPSPRVACDRCGRSYLDHRTLALHCEADHPPTYDPRERHVVASVRLEDPGEFDVGGEG